MTDKIVMCPTVARAGKEWRRYCKTLEPVIKSTKKFPFSIELINEMKIIFRGETEGYQAVRGYRADICSIDDMAYLVDELVDTKLTKALGEVGEKE